MPSIVYDVSFKSRQLTQDELIKRVRMCFEDLEDDIHSHTTLDVAKLIAQIEIEPIRESFMHHLLDKFCLSDLAKECVKDVVLMTETA